MQEVKENFSYNKFTLVFNNKTVENEFKKETIDDLFTYFKIGSFLGLVVYATFIFFDYLESKETFNLLLTNRIIVFAVVFIFFALLFTPFTRKYYYFSVIFVFLTLGIGVVHATYITNSYISSIYSVIIFFNLIPFLTIPIAIACNAFLTILFYIVLLYSTSFNHVYVFKELALLTTAVFFTILATYIKQTVERNNYIKTKRIKDDKTKIDSQYNELELTHKNITDSINYAERIQKALFPSQEILDRLPIDIELFYRPRDTIGGDFYWVDEVEDTIIVAIGDCTGHGVPGAIMTSLGINGLINSVTEQRMTDPSKILTYLDDYIDGLLSDSDQNTHAKDGMDIGIVAINKKTNSISFSNASRPLVCVDKGEISIIKSSMRSIGSKYITTPFITETLTLSKTATYYLFSDGMTDQFGGERNKRLSSKVFNQLLIQWSVLPLLDQKNELIAFYADYSKDSKQTDDMIWGAIQIK